MATVTYWAGTNFAIENLAGSGLGFYGDNGFGTSIAVGSYNGRTFITDSTGTEQGPEVDNCKWGNFSGVIVGQTGSPIHLLNLPNYLSTVNIQFAHSTAVKVQNAKLYGYDRVSKNNSPSGVTLWGAEIIHPGNTQVTGGSGDAVWVAMSGSVSYLTLASGPGVSGESPNGANTTSTNHSWYVAISPVADAVGSHTFGLFFETEYL